MNDWAASRFTGIVTQASAIPRRAHDPVCAVASATAPAELSAHEPATASGIGWDANHAEAACIGEAIERWQARPLPDDQRLSARFDRWPLDEPAVDPATWVLFHEDQYRQPGFPYRPLKRDSECVWVCCREARTGSPRWAPSEFVYLHDPPGQRFTPGLSTGLAAGRTGDPLLLRGLQEVIERDAIVGAWWGRYPLHEQSFENMLARLGPEIRERVVRPNLTYRCFRALSPFSDHVTIVTLEGEDREGYCFNIGSACRETRDASWTKSLLEAIHGRHYVRHLKRRMAEHEGIPTTFAEHAVHYSLHPAELQATPLFRAARTEDDDNTAIESIATLIERLGPSRPVLFRSMTPPALAAENLGWHVLRVVVPGLQPLHGHQVFPHLGGPLWAPRTLADWNAVPPHPFP
jgi:ribosomal protein S12 methylthiotransferase accessory factor